MKMIDLFAGIGGFSLAGHWMGWETVAFVEWEEYPQKVLAKNFTGVPIYGDIKEFNQFTERFSELDGRRYWESEPDVGRVANGISHRVDRLKGLGNAIVPQVAYEIFKAIDLFNE